MKKSIKWVKKNSKGHFVPTKELKKKAWLSDNNVYKKSLKNPVAFWGRLAKEGLEWFKKWKKTYEWKPPYFKWFIGGKINASYNALDRHINTWRRNKAAIIWIPEPVEEEPRILTYYDLYRKVNKFANVLKSLGVKKGDRVGIYLPMIPEVQITMLACARIGAIHSVVFSAFSGESLNQRMIDAEAKVLVTADGYYRKGKQINLKKNADIGAKKTKIKHVVVVKRMGNKVNMVKKRDKWWHELMKDEELYCKPQVMNSEDTLFILYTSGTTGKPKGIIHDTGGYMTQAHWTTRLDYDIHNEDVF
jgi:acetyl-CoA synthetase